jgi:hypothetical protein
MGELFPSLIPALHRADRAVGRGLRKFGRAMIYLLPVLVLIHLIAVVVTGRQLQGDIERLTKAGIIVPAKELIPAVPAGAENAADVYEQAWGALRLSREDDAALFEQWVKHDANWLALARRVVAANPEYYRLVDRASRMPHCVFPVEWEPMVSASFPHFSQMRQAARMLALRANTQAADGRAGEALGSVEAVFRVAEQAKTDPVIIADLVSYAIQGIGLRALSETLPTGAPSPAACRSLYDQLGKTDNVASSRRTVRGEVVLMGMDTFNLVRSGRISLTWLMRGDEGQASLGGRPRLRGRLRAWLLRPVLNADERVYLSYMEREVRSFELPYPESRQAMDDLNTSLETRTPIYALLTRLVMPIFGRAVWSRDRATAAVGAAQIALALKAYRSEHDSYPPSLAELGAAGWKLPLDPFGGKPYRYRREGSGFVVWSLGPDMDDDNAARDYDAYQKLKGPHGPGQREEIPEDYDIVFRCRL